MATVFEREAPAAASTKRDLLAELGVAAAAFLKLMTMTAECMEQSAPGIGSPYRKRILGLQARLSFDVTPKAIRDTLACLEDEIKDFGAVMQRLQTERTVELERGILAVRDLREKVTRQHDAHGKRLLEFASEIARTPGSADALPAPADRLRTLVTEMGQDIGSTLAKMREETYILEKSFWGASSMDPVTGIMNRQEFERQVAAHQLNESPYAILLFRMRGPVGNEVIRQAAVKLTAEFRHRDRIARWSQDEFAVLFAGPPEIADSRGADAAARLSGPYTLENGEVVHITAVVRSSAQTLPA